MTTTNYSMCMLFICLFASCGTGEKRTDESIRIKVAEVEMSVPSSEREFSFISKPFKETELSFRVGGPIDRFEVYAGNYYQRGDIIAEIDSRDFRIRKERAEAIYNQAKALCENTGYDELSLASLSTSDHSDIQNMLSKLIDYTEGEHINLSLPSLRIDNYVSKLANVSRAKAIELMQNNKVSVNYCKIKEKSKEIQENNVITISGIGKFRTGSIVGNTKSGKFKVVIKNYI